MSNYFGKAKHPETGEIQEVYFMDDYYGPHRYGVKFPDGKIFPDHDCQILPPVQEQGDGT